MGRKQAHVNALSLVEVLEPLSTEELEELAERCPDVRLQKGEGFYRPNEHDGGLFLVTEGRVRVFGISPRGEELTLALLGSGTALSARRLRGLHAQAVEPSVLAFVPRRELERLVRKKPEVGLRLVNLLTERLRLMDARMSDVIHKRVPARLASLIAWLIEEEGIVEGSGDRIIPYHYTHEQLGTIIGARRVAITLAFRVLQEEGVVELKQRRIHVKDLNLLQRIAEQEI